MTISNSKVEFQFQSDIKGDFSKFARENFSDFISSMGGFSDIADYISHVKSGRISVNPMTSETETVIDIKSIKVKD